MLYFYLLSWCKCATYYKHTNPQFLHPIVTVTETCPSDIAHAKLNKNQGSCVHPLACLTCYNAIMSDVLLSGPKNVRTTSHRLQAVGIWWASKIIPTRLLWELQYDRDCMGQVLKWKKPIFSISKASQGVSSTWHPSDAKTLCCSSSLHSLLPHGPWTEEKVPCAFKNAANNTFLHV
jgi:hypothetical protein